MCALANSEYPDEMLHIMAFHWGLHHLLLKTKQSTEKEIQFYLRYILHVIPLDL